jgi:hypothetical protein
MFRGAHRERVRFAIRSRVKGSCWITYPGFGEDVLFCVVDTGTNVTSIPQKFWSQYLTNEFVSSLPTKSVSGVGGNIDVRETELPLKISGLDFKRDEPFDLGRCKVWLALDQDAGKPMEQVLLGVGGGVLEKGGLCINWKEQQAYFIEVDDI